MSSLAAHKDLTGNTSMTRSPLGEVEGEIAEFTLKDMVANGAKRLKVAEEGLFETGIKPTNKMSLLANREIVDSDLIPSVITLGDAFQSRVVGKRSMHTLQEWEGFVETVEEDGFVARLKDLTSPKQSVETAEIPSSVVDREDRNRIAPGAVFRMTVGVAVTDHGNRINDAVIYFRRFTENNVGAQVAGLIRSFNED